MTFLIIKNVQFKFHESYANPNRVVSKPPYEVSETVSCEFEIPDVNENWRPPLRKEKGTPN